MRVLLRKSQLVIDVHDRCAIGHDIGYPVVDLFVGLTNKGGKPLTIRSIELHVSPAGQQPFVLYARSYFATTNSQNPLLMVPEKLMPEARWGHVVKFLPETPRLEEREVVARKLAVQNDIAQKVRAAKHQGLDGELQHAEEALVAPLREIFARQFRWGAGDYGIQLVVRRDDDGKSKETYNLVLFESESEELRSIAGEYDEGAGVFFAPNRPGVFPKLSKAV